jgi:hypothetical protein
LFTSSSPIAGTIGAETRYFTFSTLDELRAFVIRCHPEGASLEEFDNDVRRWARGSIYVNLIAEQYAALKTASGHLPIANRASQYKEH